jgi:hypothetical protein
VHSTEAVFPSYCYSAQHGGGIFIRILQSTTLERYFHYVVTVHSTEAIFSSESYQVCIREAVYALFNLK